MSNTTTGTLQVEVGETGYAAHPVLLVLNGHNAVLDQVNEMVLPKAGASQSMQILPDGEDGSSRYPLAFKTADAAKAFLANLRQQGYEVKSAAKKTTINDALTQVVEAIAARQKH